MYLITLPLVIWSKRRVGVNCRYFNGGPSSRWRRQQGKDRQIGYGDMQFFFIGQDGIEMSRIFTSGLLLCVEAAFERVHTFSQEYSVLEEVQTEGSRC